MRDCLCVCFKLRSLVPESVGVLLSPLGDFSCLVVSVPLVALSLVELEMIGDGVAMLEIGWFVIVDGACLDLDLSEEIGVSFRALGLIGGGAGGCPGGCPWSVDIGVMILVAMD